MDIVAIIWVKRIDFFYQFGFDRIELPQFVLMVGDFLLDSRSINFHVDFCLHCVCEAWITYELNKNFCYCIVQQLLLNLLLKGTFISILHLTVFAAVIIEILVLTAVLFILNTFVAV